MKLAFVAISGMSWGGSEVLWSKTAAAALQAGHSVLVSVPGWPEQPPAIKNLAGSGAKMIYRRIPHPALFARVVKKTANILLSPGKKLTYHEYLNRFAADRILINMAGGTEIAYDEDLMLFIRQTNIPYFVFCHSLSLTARLPRNVLSNLIECFSKAAKVFFTSNIQINVLQQQLGRLFTNFQVMNHPLKTMEAVAWPESGQINFAMIGHLVNRWKGFDRAITILGSGEWINRNWILNIYGEGEDRQVLQKLVADKKLEQKVIFHGYVNDQRLIWKKNQALIIASRQDSGPITLFEAMQAGRMVIATDMGAAPDYIADEVNGVIAADASDNCLAAAMERAWQNKDRWQEWALAARNMLQKKYDFEPEKTLLFEMTA